MAAQTPRLVVELEEIQDQPDGDAKNELLAKWEDRWIVRVTDTNIANITALLDAHPGKYLGVLTDDLSHFQLELADFSTRVGSRLETLWLPADPGSHLVFFRRYVEHSN